MREILFRGKRLDNSEWVYGSFIQVEHEDGSFTTAIFQKKDAGGDAEVSPVTVGQYTGLKDKHGKRIFEGDIVRLSELYYSGKAVIRFCGAAFKACEEVFSYQVSESMEVIGNIHDNKSLLNNQEAGE